jgi:hypothetical protein
MRFVGYFLIFFLIITIGIDSILYQLDNLVIFINKINAHK